MSRPVIALTMVCILLGVFPAATADLDDTLDKQFRGAWATVDVEIYSSCSGTYSDNTVGAAGVTSKAGRRFDAGELVKIDKIKVKRARVDFLVRLAEPVLVAHQEGPFELFDEHQCKAQLIFEFPRTVIKGGDLDIVKAAISKAFRTHPSQAEARESGDWNGRERESYPDDYEQTLARHEQWKAEQINIAVTAGIEKATSEATEVADDIERDADYLDGFAAGAEKLQSLDIDDCSRLIDASFSSFKKRPPSDKSAKWKRGFNDGQSLVFHLYLLQKLQHCYVPVPAVPIP